MTQPGSATRTTNPQTPEGEVLAVKDKPEVSTLEELKAHGLDIAKAAKRESWPHIQAAHDAIDPVHRAEVKAHLRAAVGGGAVGALDEIFRLLGEETGL